MRVLRRALPAGLCAALVGLAAPAAARDEGAKVQEGRPAPAVELPATQVDKALPDKKGATTLNLKDLHGKNVVLFFFPKAMTKG
jgi:hypothetical protein